MTVEELIKALQEQPRDAIVFVRHMDDLFKACMLDGGELLVTLYVHRGEQS